MVLTRSCGHSLIVVPRAHSFASARADSTSLRESGRIKFSGMTKDNYGAAASVRANLILGPS
jgi:hypothetical protein